MNEKLIERKLREGVRKRGGLALKFGTSYHIGMPDREVLMPGGRTYFVELKTTGRKPTVLQNIAIDQLRGLGFSAEVIDNEQDLKNFFNKIDRDAERK